MQKCDLQVWELNVPLKCAVTPSLYVWGQDGQLRWDPALTSALPEGEWPSQDGPGGGSCAMDAQEAEGAGGEGLVWGSCGAVS